MNKRDGAGILKTKDGLSYQGTFSNNQLHGQVIVYDLNGGYFRGDWIYGQPQGTGRYVGSDGSVKSGTWSEKGYAPASSQPIKKEVKECFQCKESIILF